MKTFVGFERNVWKDVPEALGNIILRDNPNFFGEHELIFSPSDFSKSGLKVCLYRFGALGDLIQLIPLMRYFKKTTNCNFTLATSKQYVAIFSEQKDLFDSVIENVKMKKWDYDRIIFLDGILENDHNLVNEDHLIHRVKLYEKFFGVNIDSYDFSLNVPNESYQKARKLLNDFIV